MSLVASTKHTKKVQPVAIDPMTAKISELCMPQPTLHGRRKLFRCLPKRRCWCFRWCREAPLPPSTASSRSSTSSKWLSYISSRMRVRGLVFANLSAFRAFCRFLRTDCPKRMAPAGRPPAPPLDRRFSVHSFKFCTTSMSQCHIVLGCLRRALCPAAR